MSLVRSARIRLFSNTATWFVYTAMILAQLAGLSMAEAYLNAGADWLSSSVSQRLATGQCYVRWGRGGERGEGDNSFTIVVQTWTNLFLLILIFPPPPYPEKKSVKKCVKLVFCIEELSVTFLGCY